MNRQFKECIVTVAALAAYGLIFLSVIGVILGLLFCVLAVWSAFFDLLK